MGGEIRLKPLSEGEVLEAVEASARQETPLEILGAGSKRAVGHRVESAAVLDLSSLTGVTFYEPEELVLSVMAGTPLAEIEELLASSDQELAFEPMDFGPLQGLPRGSGTIGGVLAGNVSGPKRLKAGAARDHVLGVRAVSGRGEIFKSGGRVVKNVTGYDLSKGLAGSWGTLAVLTEITFKVLPRPKAGTTLAIAGLADTPAVAALCAAMGSTGEVSAAAHIPACIVETLPVPTLSGSGASATLLRLEGFRPSVAYRAERLSALMQALGPLALIEGAESERLWRAIRDVEPFGSSERALWKVSVAPTAGPRVVEALATQTGFRHFYDWSGGLVWIELHDEAPDAHAGILRAAIQEAGGGSATLVRGSRISEAVPRFHPLPEALAALSRRLKSGFDPLGILNPGRMQPA